MEKCFNPHCNLSHSWDKKTVKSFEDALCSSCRTQMASIYISSEKSCQELKIYFSKEFEQALKNN
jgi:hypothetical protein